MNSSTSSFKARAKKAVGQLLAFIFFLFLFDRLLFLGIRSGESRYYGSISSYALEDKFAAARDRGEYPVLILGTSRTFDGIHPRHIYNQLGVRAFKEAFVGKGPMYSYFFYQEYRRHMGIPRVVIYGVDYFMFNITSERHWMKRFPADLIDAHYFKAGPSLLLANKRQIDELSNLMLNNLKERTGGDLNYQIERDWARMESYVGVPSPGKIDEAEPQRFARQNFAGFPGKEGEYFALLLDQLQKDRVQVMLVGLPEYIGTYWTNRNHNRFQQVFGKFARRLPGVFFYNYNRPEKFDLARAELFIDGGYGFTNSHLSSTGSAMLGRMLADDLRQHLGMK